MEEILILLIQGLFELVVQMLTYGGFDWWWYSHDDAPSGAFWWGLALFLIGMGVAAIVNLWHPHALLPWAWLRIAWLPAGPILNGLLSRGIARWRLAHGAAVSPTRHFWYAFLFSLGFVVVRFAWSAH